MKLFDGSAPAVILFVLAGALFGSRGCATIDPVKEVGQPCLTADCAALQAPPVPAEQHTRK